MTIVPSEHLAMAAAMAGESSVELEPPAAGVQLAPVEVSTVLEEDVEPDEDVRLEETLLALALAGTAELELEDDEAVLLVADRKALSIHEVS